MHENRVRQEDKSWRKSAWDFTNILQRAWKNTREKHLSLVAGGVAYFLMLALFPGLAALVSIYGLIANPAEVTKHVHALSGLLPPSTVTLIARELHQIASASIGSLGLSVVVGIVIALWSSLHGMTGMMSALNIAYGQTEGRGFLKFYTVGLALAFVIIAGGLTALGLITVLPIVLHELGLHGVKRWIGLVIEWPILIMFANGVVALIYRFGPDHKKQKWEWASPGAITATILWIAGSSVFSFYVYHFNSYSRTYGSLGALLILLIWLWLSAFVVLLGAEINGEAERRTNTGRPSSMPKHQLQ